MSKEFINKEGYIGHCKYFGPAFVLYLRYKKDYIDPETKKVMFTRHPDPELYSCEIKCGNVSACEILKGVPWSIEE